MAKNTDYYAAKTAKAKVKASVGEEVVTNTIPVEDKVEVVEEPVVEEPVVEEPVVEEPVVEVTADHSVPDDNSIPGDVAGVTAPAPEIPIVPTPKTVPPKTKAEDNSSFLAYRRAQVVKPQSTISMVEQRRMKPAKKIENWITRRRAGKWSIPS